MNIIAEISNIVKDEEKSAEILLNEIVFNISNEDDTTLKKYQENLKLSKNKFDKVQHIINENKDNLRYWFYNNRNYYEVNFDGIIEDMLLQSKPKNDLILSCIEKLGDDGLDNLIFGYMMESTNHQDIKNKILSSFEDDVYYNNKESYERLLNCHNKEISYEYDIDDFLSGYIYAYKDNNQIKVFLPKEIKSILKKTNINRLKPLDTNFDDFGSFNEISDIIFGYINMNGIIENKTLQRILKDNHNIDISIKEMDIIIKKNGFEILDKKYYTVGMDKEDANKLLNIKNNKDDYKKYDITIDLIENDFLDTVHDFVDNNFNYNKEEIESTILLLTKLGIMNKDNFDFIGDELHLNKSQKNKILEMIKTFKNIVSIWPLNGYSLNENNNNKEKQVKIGRNEPCPCGSGKKYKNCHGR